MDRDYFSTAFAKVIKWEGAYSNNPIDPGGETFMGVSRVKHPDWYGWSRIDKHKNRASSFPASLEEDYYLLKLVEDFYKHLFWNKVYGNMIAKVNKNLAFNIFECAINQGMYYAILHFQKVLNIMNENQRRYPDIIEDGVFGSKTKATFEHCAEFGDFRTFLIWYNVLQGNRYIQILKTHPEQEIFARGWARRIELTRKD